MRRQLSWKVVAAAGVALGALIAGAAATYLAAMHEIALQGASVANRVLARALEEQADATFREVEAILAGIAVALPDRPEYGRPGDAALRQFLIDRIGRSPAVENLTVLDPGGAVIHEAFGPVDPAAEGSIQPYLDPSPDDTRDILIGAPRQSRVRDLAVLPVGRRIWSGDGLLLGTAVASVETRYFRDFYEALALGPGSAVSLWRRDGTLLVRVPHDPAAVGRLWPGARARLRDELPEEGAIVRTTGQLDGVERTYLYRPVGSRALAVAVGFATDHVLDDWRRNRSFVAWSAAGAVMAVLAMTLLVLRLLIARGRDAAALGQTERLSRSVVDTVVDGVIMIDHTGRIERFNRAAERIFGYSESDILGRNVRILMPEPDSAAHDSYIANYLRTGDAKIIGIGREVRGRRRDGAVFPMELGIGRIAQDGAPPKFIGTVRDIGDRKRSELRLRESEERFRLLVENTKDYAIFLLDEQGHVATWNTGAERIKGWRADEVIGRHYSIFFTASDCESGVPSQNLAVAAAEGRFEIVGQRVRKDGSLFWADIVIDVARDEQGKPSGYVKIIRDITERRAAEAQLRQVQKIEALGQLTGGVAHDFNNRLGTMLMNLEFLRERVSGDASARAAADSSIRAVTRAAALTAQLLAFSRRQPLRPQVIDLNDAITDAVSLAKAAVSETISFRLALAPKLRPVSLDRGQLENALLNLVLNARDAMPAGGNMTIETKNVRIEADDAARYVDFEPGDYVMCSVADTGIGMAPDVLERAFDPFFTTKEAGKGTGLGLSMVHGFVRQSRGQIRIYSEVGRGTTARLFFPIAEQGAAAGEEPPHPAVRGGTESILVVDDDGDLRDSLATLLKALGYRVGTAADGPAALALLREDRSWDLLLTDIGLPRGMRGPDVARQARALKPDLPVLYMSGHIEIQDESEVDPGSVLAKPFHRADVAERIRALLDGRCE